MKNIIKILSLFFFITNSFLIYSAPVQLSQLDKVFHHTSKNKMSVELGSVAFYFTKGPKVHLLSKHKTATGQSINTYFFPGVHIKNKNIKQMVDLVNASKGHNQPYSIAIEVVEKNNPGIKFIVVYDANKINMAYDAFDSIGLKKGLIFRFFNKELLNKLKKQSTPVRRTAYNKGVVIDCGHGGRDVGTIGFDAIKEKDVTLGIGLKVAHLLRSKGVEVFLTRSRDQYLFLDQRTSSANSWGKADAFISIHANYSANNNVSGIETFCLNNSLFNSCFNELSHDLASIQQKLAQNICNQSNILAKHIQEMTVTYAQKKNPHALNRNVKHAVSQVLTGTIMPSILIEVGFVSHPYEAKLLASKEYQQILAKGISDGIISYLKSVTV